MMMNSGVKTSSLLPSSSSSIGHTSLHPSILTSTHQLSHPRISLSSWSHSHSTRPHFPRLSCSPRPPGSGESDNKTVLDAFFLGKALGEALTERIESAVGEVLSTIGRLQSEQQKQVQEFQEDVLERAKRAKEKAAREALQDQGRLIPSSTEPNASATNGSTSSASLPTSGSSSPTSVDDQNSPSSGVDEDCSDQGYISSVQID